MARLLMSVMLVMFLGTGCATPLTTQAVVARATSVLGELQSSQLHLLSEMVEPDGSITRQSSASAVVYAKKSSGEVYAITARHATEAFNRFTVQFGERSLGAKRVYEGEGYFGDYAFLQVLGSSEELGELKPVARWPHEPMAYEPCRVLGYAMGLGSLTLTDGRIQPSEGSAFLRISAPVIYGNSGGGVYIERDGSWRLVGIVVAGMVARGVIVSHMGLCVPVSVIEDAYEREVASWHR